MSMSDSWVVVCVCVCGGVLEGEREQERLVAMGTGSLVDCGSITGEQEPEKR